jgi:hypothetical protein
MRRTIDPDTAVRGVFAQGRWEVLVLIVRRSVAEELSFVKPLLEVQIHLPERDRVSILSG